MRSGGSSDSLQFEKRDFSADSVTVISTDTSIPPGSTPWIHPSMIFIKSIPLRPEHISLGNIGNAIRPVLFRPL